VERTQGFITGTAVSLEHDGTLIVATTEGNEEVRYGDIIHLRRAETS